MRTGVAVLIFACLSALASPAWAAPHYPMSPDDFQESVDRKVEATWSRIEKKLLQHRVSEERRSEIREAFDEAVSKVTEAIEKASEDDKITRGEAYRINTMTSGLRGKLRGKLAREKGSATPASETISPRSSHSDEELDSRDPVPAKKAKKGIEGTPKQGTRKPAPHTSAGDESPSDSKGSSETKPKKTRRS